MGWSRNSLVLLCREHLEDFRTGVLWCVCARTEMAVADVRVEYFGNNFNCFDMAVNVLALISEVLFAITGIQV